MNWHIKLEALFNISFEVFVLMNSINPIKFGMFAMMNDSPYVMFNIECKLWSDDMSLKLDYILTNPIATFLIGHVYYKRRATLI